MFKILDVSSYIFLLLTVLLVPLFVDRRLINFYIIPKQYVFIGLVLLSTLLYVTKIVLSKKVQFRRSILDLPLLVLLFLALVSSIFSANIYDSFFGRNEYFVLNFIFLLFSVLFYFLLTNFLRTPLRWRWINNAVVSVGGLTALVFILKMVFKLDLLTMWYAPIWNTIDKLNSLFGLWLIIVFIISAGQLIRKNLPVGWSLLYFFIAVLTFTSLVLLSFNVLWWLLLAGLVLLLLLGVSFVKEARLGWLSILFALLILTVIFISFGTPKSLQSVLPAEVALGISPSWKISSETLFSGVKDFFVGSGLGSFSTDFSKFRPESFNYDNMAWSLRFGQPFSTMLSFMAEGGMLFTLVFIFIFLFILGHVLHAWFKMRSEGMLQNMVSNYGLEQPDMRLDVFLTVVAWVVLTIGMVVMFFNPVLWWMWWLFLGLIISGLAFISSDIIKTKEWVIEDTPQYSLSFSFILIVIMASVVMLGVWGARLYMAETAYARALKAGDYKTAENELQGALTKRSNTDTYHAALAQVYLLEAVNASKEARPDMQKISGLVAMAVNEAKAATNLSPYSIVLWENLATMYENASALVPEAGQWVIKSLDRAKELEPTNPVLFWRLGNSYSLSGNWEEAVKSYEQAIKLKNDYIGAYSGLASAYEQNNKIDKAIETYQNILPAAMQNSEVLFNFGRLLYNRNKGDDRSNAEKLWQEAVKVQPNYSNALYSLGLFYENKGDSARALQYYYKVKDLNPDNKDVSAKIRNIIGGK